MTNTEVSEKVSNGYRLPRPKGCPLQIYQLMRRCWRGSPRKRPNFTELYSQLDEIHATILRKGIAFSNSSEFESVEVEMEEQEEEEDQAGASEEKTALEYKRNLKRPELSEAPKWKCLVIKPSYSVCCWRCFTKHLFGIFAVFIASWKSGVVWGYAWADLCIRCNCILPIQREQRANRKTSLYLLLITPFGHN